MSSPTTGIDAAGQSGGSNYGSGYTQSMGTGSSTSQYLIPGAKASYQNLGGALDTAYNGVQGQLAQGYNALDPSVLGGYGSLYQQALGDVANYGQVQQQQLQNQYAQQGAQQQQNLLNRGLGNSTVQNSIQTGLTQSEALARQNLGQNINQQQLGVLGSFGNQLVGAQQQLGQNKINQTLGLSQQQLAGQQSLGQQYQGQVGQQGIQTSSNQNASTGTNASSSANQAANTQGQTNYAYGYNPNGTPYGSPGSGSPIRASSSGAAANSQSQGAPPYSGGYNDPSQFTGQENYTPYSDSYGVGEGYTYGNNQPDFSGLQRL